MHSFRRYSPSAQNVFEVVGTKYREESGTKAIICETGWSAISYDLGSCADQIKGD